MVSGLKDSLRWELIGWGDAESAYHVGGTGGGCRGNGATEQRGGCRLSWQPVALLHLSRHTANHADPDAYRLGGL